MLTRARGPDRDHIGAVAQLVERLLCKEKVRSSNLLGSTGSAPGVSFEVRRREARPPRRGGQTAYNQLPLCTFSSARDRVSWSDANEQMVNLYK